MGDKSSRQCGTPSLTINFPQFETNPLPLEAQQSFQGDTFPSRSDVSIYRPLVSNCKALSIIQPLRFIPGGKMTKRHENLRSITPLLSSNTSTPIPPQLGNPTHVYFATNEGPPCLLLLLLFESVDDEVCNVNNCQIE